MGSSAMDAMQVLFTAFDTGLSSKWREEDRSWRDEDRSWRCEDLDYRREEREWREQEKDMRELELRWREEDIEQRHVENARYLWMSERRATKDWEKLNGRKKWTNKNRRDVEEKSEQLKAVSSLAALFAGFAVVTLTQFGFDAETVGIIWIAFYGVLTALVVGLMTISMVTCTLILGSILKNGKLYVNEEAEEDFMFRCKAFIRNHKENPALKPPFPRRTFEAFWRIRCETDWRRSFQLFALGVLSFLVSLVPIGWIKFSYSPVTAGLFIGIVGISIVGWGCVQYSWGSHMTSNIRSLEDHETRVHPGGLPFGWHLSPVEQTTL